MEDSLESYLFTMAKKKKFLNVPMERIVAQVKKEGKRKFLT